MSNLHAVAITRPPTVWVDLHDLTTGDRICYHGETWVVQEVLPAAHGRQAVIGIRDDDGLRAVLLWANPEPKAELLP